MRVGRWLEACGGRAIGLLLCRSARRGKTDENGKREEDQRGSDPQADRSERRTCRPADAEVGTDTFFRFDTHPQSMKHCSAEVRAASTRAPAGKAIQSPCGPPVIPPPFNAYV